MLLQVRKPVVKRVGNYATCAITVILLAGAAPFAHAADANELFAIGAVQKGTGGAGIASPKDATWVLMNPASIVDLERRFDCSLELLQVKMTTEPDGLPLLSNPLAGELEYHAFIQIPSFGVVWPLDKGTMGVGVFGVLGNRANFKRSRSTLAAFMHADRRSAYEVARIPISYGYRFDNGWAVGGSVVAAYTRFRTDSLTLALRPTLGDFQWDIAFGVGFQLAAYKKWDEWSLGATYTSRTWMQDYDKYKSDLVRWNFDLPQKLQIGAAYRPIPDLEFVLDYKWVNWSQVNLLGRETIQGGLGWKDQSIFKGGVTWDVNDRWTLRSGVSWGNSAVQNDHIFANILTPALGQWHAAAGFSYRLNERSTAHLTFSHAFTDARTDNGRGDLFSQLGKDSKARYAENSLTFEYSYAF